VSNHAEVIPSVCLLRVEPQCLFEVSLRFRKIPFEEQRPAQRKLAAGIVWSQFNVTPEVRQRFVVVRCIEERISECEQKLRPVWLHENCFAQGQYSLARELVLKGHLQDKLSRDRKSTRLNSSH